MTLRDHLHYRHTSLKYRLFYKINVCEIIDEIKIEHLRMTLARARKELQLSVREETPVVVIT